MLKAMSPAAIERCLARAAASPMAAGGVEYPSWYLHRWHFLPEGYLSSRSARLYDSLVRRIYNVAFEARLHAALVSRIRRQAPGAVLDLACGPGHSLAALRRALPFAELAGIDLSPFVLERAQHRLANEEVTLLHGDALALPSRDGSLDAVVTQHFLGHLPPALRPAAWGEAARVLKPGGRLYVLDHGWHPQFPGSLVSRESRGLLGGILRLDVFERVEAN